MSNASWISEADEPLPLPHDDIGPVRLVVCPECGRTAASPPTALSECTCGGQTVEHEIDRDEYHRLRVRGEVPQSFDGDRELITDGGTEVVYVARNRFSSSRSIYHTDRDCQYLDRAASVVEKELSALFGHYEKCEECAGTIDRSQEPDWSHYEALQDAASDDEDQEIVTDGGRVETPLDPHELSLNPGREELGVNPLCPRCRTPILPISNAAERRFVCACDTVWQFTFDEDGGHPDGSDDAPNPHDFRIPTIAELDQMRADAGLSMKDLSECAGFQDDRFSHILNNDTNPHTDTIRAFLTALQEFDGHTDTGDQGPDPTPSEQTADVGDGPTEVEADQIATMLDRLNADDNLITDGGTDDVVPEVTDRSVEDLSKTALKREWSEACEQLRGPLPDERRETVLDRRTGLWNEMRDRTDAEPPACPECGGQRWSQAMGDPKECVSCGLMLGARHEDLIQEIDSYWRKVKATDVNAEDLITDGGTTTRPGGAGECPQGCHHPVAGEQTMEYHEETVPVDPPNVFEMYGETVVQTERTERYQRCIVCGWRIDL